MRLYVWSVGGAGGDEEVVAGGVDDIAVVALVVSGEVGTYGYAAVLVDEFAVGVNFLAVAVEEAYKKILGEVAIAVCGSLGHVRSEAVGLGGESLRVGNAVVEGLVGSRN